MWTCSKCAESIEDQFDSCWNCAPQREETPSLAGRIPFEGSIDPNGLLLDLHAIRRRRRLTWIVFLLFGPVVWLTAARFGSHGALYAALLSMAIFATANALVHQSKCPRCGRPFHTTGGWHNPWTRKCLHCQLRLDSFEPCA